MSGGRRNTLNLEADLRFGDPTAVSDPACWITGEAAEALKQVIPSKVSLFRYVPRYQDNDRVLDLSVENLPE